MVAEVAIGVTPQVAQELGTVSLDDDPLHAESHWQVGQKPRELKVGSLDGDDALRKRVDLAPELEGFIVGALTCM